MLRRAASIVAVAIALATAKGAAAQDGMTKATAEALFADGKRLMAAGDFRAACPKFAASQKLEPGVGTVLNLADCYERLGRVASAWAEFRSAASAARAAGSTDRERLATDRAKALDARLSYLTITSSTPPAAGIQIARDGERVEPAVLGTAIPIDPGKHTIDATLPGKPKWTVSIDVSAEPSRVSVNVPDLTDGGPLAGASPRAADPKNYGTAQRGVGIGLGVLGVMGIAAGTVFGLKASSNWDDARSHCTSYPVGCDATAVSLAQDAKSSGNTSTVAFVVGAAGLAGGAVVFLTAPKNRNGEAGLSIRIVPSGLSVAGRF